MKWLDKVAFMERMKPDVPVKPWEESFFKGYKPDLSKFFNTNSTRKKEFK
jgi:hypothetical protein